METIPAFLAITFGLIVLTTLILLYKSTRSILIIAVSIAFLFIQTVLGISGFYTHTFATPPPMLLLAGPSLIAIILLFALPAGRKLLNRFDPKWMTWLSIIRIPVELVLFGLFTYKLIPRLMTFEGQNFDILSGLSAPFIAWFGYQRHKISSKYLLAWNFICLGLLLNVVIRAILAVPGPFQQLAFDQPNVAVLYFPFVWLPGFVVPVVLLSHLVNIRALILKAKINQPKLISSPTHSHFQI